jgi:dTDP-4-amino-4,6-dideoxygalactose transaminase
LNSKEFIKFNVPNQSTREVDFVADAVERRHLAGKGYYNKSCKDWFKKELNLVNTYLTPSCTDALEMAAILCNIEPGDEVIVPSYTFVSTANAFATKGAKIVFADSLPNSPNVDVESIKSLITSNTKAVVAVHYGGFSCDIQSIKDLTTEKNLYLIEDAACALGSFANIKALGSFGDIATFSFHETKNVTCGKGGLIVVNNENLNKRAPVVWEKGTNRAAYFNGEVDKYGWVDYGSSFMMSELSASFLYGQLIDFKQSQRKRHSIWSAYAKGLIGLLPFEYLNNLNSNEHNAHCFYGVFENKEKRQHMIQKLKEKGIQAVFHYQALHNSNFSQQKFGMFECSNATKYEECLLRLPLHSNMTNEDVDYIISSFTEIFNELR